MMKNLRKAAAALLVVLPALYLCSPAGRSESRLVRAAVDTSSAAAKAARQERPAKGGAMSAGEKQVRDVYARLMRYQSASVDEWLADTGRAGAPEDYLTYELRDIRVGAVADILSRPLSEMVTPRGHVMLSLRQVHLGAKGATPHAYYEARWTDAPHGKERPNAAVRDVPGAAAFDRYASYRVSVSYQGRQVSYRALMLYRQSGGARVEILDNFTADMNTVYADVSPRVRSPWHKYVRSSLYLAVAQRIEEARRAGKPPVPADAPIGYLPGDDVSGDTPQAQAALMSTTYDPCSTANCSCSSPLSDGEWNDLKGSFPNLVRAQTCKLAPATGTYNCMAWTLDDTSRWWWFEADANGDQKLSISEVNAFYSSKGKSNIAYYGPSTADIVHVAKKSGGNGSDCNATSKLGSHIRMAHDLGQLAGGFYSNIVGGN